MDPSALNSLPKSRTADEWEREGVLTVASFWGRDPPDQLVVAIFTELAKLLPRQSRQLLPRICAAHRSSASACKHPDFNGGLTVPRHGAGDGVLLREPFPKLLEMDPRNLPALL